MAVVSGKWDTARLEDGVNLRTGGANNSLCTSCSEDSAQEISFFAAFLRRFPMPISISFSMATVDLNHVQFWAPPSNQFLYKQRTTSQSTGRSICTNSSRNEPAPLHKADRIFKRNDQSKSAITAARHQGDDFAARAQGTIRRDSRKYEPV